MHGASMTLLSRNAVVFIIDEIEPPDELWRVRARAHLDTLTKPLGSLGHLEHLAAQLAAIPRADSVLPMSKAVYVFGADHGITAEGVSAYPSAVTKQMVLNFLACGAAVSVLARLHGVALHGTNMGVDGKFENASGLLHRKVCKGMRNMLREAAMTDDELSQALRAGAELAAEA